MVRTSNRGVFIPDYVLFDIRLSHGEKILFSIILHLSISASGCFASDKYFSKRLGVGKRQIRNMLQKLDEMGLIYRDEEYDGKRLITACPENLREY